MRPYYWSVLMILLAGAAAPGQTVPADALPIVPGSVRLPPPPTTVPQAQPLPTVNVPAPLFLQPAKAEPPHLEPTHSAPAEPALPTPENLTVFDPQRLEVKKDANGWQLAVDGIVLKEFGSRENDARMALKLVRELGLNQHGTIGAPAPVLEYWLRDGKAPHGITTGLQVYSLEPAALRVEQVQEHWCVRDGQRVLFDFGPSAADAQQALGVVRKYGFVQIASLGQSGPVLLLFLGRGAAAPVATTPATKPQSSAPWPSHDWATRSNVLEHRVASPVGQPVAAAPAPIIVTAAVESPVSERTTFDWHLVEVQNDGKVWKLVAGTQELGRFLNEREAHLALSAVVNYHFNAREVVGGAKGHFSYFLTDGQLPQGAMLGAPCEVLQPERLRVVQVANHWTISSNERVLLAFDDKQDEARHVLDVIQRNKCDRLCHIGSGDYGMTFLARSR